MIDLLRSEWVKFRSVRSTVVTLLLAGALVVLIAGLVAFQAKDDTRTTCEPIPAGAPTTTTTAPVPDEFGGPGGFSEPPVFCDTGFEAVEAPVTTNLTGLTGGVSFAVLLFGVLGVQVIGQEYRFNTIRPTFTAAPKRFNVLAAKAIVVGLACAVVAFVMVAVCWLIGNVILDSFEIDGVDRRIIWAIPLFAMLWSIAGVGVGAIVRQPIAGILIMALESLILEGLIGGFFSSTQKWLPFNNGFQMTLRIDQVDTGLQTLLGGGIYFAVVCAALWGIGAFLANKRDA